MQHDVDWKVTRMEAVVGLALLTVEKTPGGKWKWTCTRGTRVSTGTEATKGEAMAEALGKTRENGHARA